MIRLVLPETKRPATLDELKAVVNSHKNEDVITRIGDIKLDQDHIQIGTKSYAVRQNGFKGLLKHLGMPFGYAASIPNDLLYDSVNRLCKTYGDFEVLVRAQDDEVRGVLDPNYVPLDTKDLVNRVSTSVEQGLVPSRINYDGDSLTLSMVTGKEVHAKDVGDISKIGVGFEASDVGLFPLSAGAYLYRLVCTNGAILPARMGGEVVFSQKKVNPDTVWSLFDEGYQRILTTMSQVDSEFLIRLDSQKVDVPGFVKAKEQLAKFAGGRKAADILKNMEADVLENGTDYTFYDIYNAVTSTARDEASLYTAQNLEKAAGELLFTFGTQKGN